LNLKKPFPYLLLLYHLAFAYFGWKYILENNGDAVRYWFEGQDLSGKYWSDFLNPGTDIIKLITFPLVKYFHFPFFVGFLLFSAWSGYGFYRLWKIMKSIAGENKILLSLSAVLLLLPNLHFWTSLIGKEAFLFVPFVIITEQMYKGKYFSFPLIFSVMVIGIVRPHAAFVLVPAVFLAVLIKGDLTLKNKLKFSAAAGSVIVLLYFALKAVAKVKFNIFRRLEYLYQIHNSKLKETSAYVPLEEYPYPYRMFTFYFRPLPFEKHGMYYRILEFEGLLLLIFMLVTTYFLLRHLRKLKWNVFILFAIFLLIFYGTMYVYAYANFGMIVRTRALVMPIFFMLIVKGAASRYKVRDVR